MKLPDRTRLLRTAIFCAVFFLIYLLLNRPEVIFIQRLGFTAWYPAAGLSMAVTIGLSPWYGLLVLVTDPIVGRLVYGTPIFSLSGSGGSLGPVVYYTLAGYILRGPWKIDSSLSRRQDVMRYVAVTITAAAGSTCVGVGVLILDHRLNPLEYWKSWGSWFGGEIIGAMAIAPFLLIHVVPGIRGFLRLPPENPSKSEGKPRRDAFRISRAIELTAQMASILVVLYVVLSRLSAGAHFMFPVFLPIIWIAMTGGVRRAATGNMLLVASMVTGLRLFPLEASVLASLSLLLLSVSATGLIVGAAISEQDHQAAELRDQTVYLNSLVENCPLPIVFLNHDHTMHVCNDAFVNFFQFSRAELRTNPIGDLIVPAGLKEQGQKLLTDGLAGGTFRIVTQRQRKDGAILDVELTSIPLVVDGQPRAVCGMYTDISERLMAVEEARRHAEQLDEMVRELQVHNTEMTFLTELNSLLQCCANLKEAYAAVSQSARKLFPAATSGILYVYRPDQKSLEGVAYWGGTAASETSFEPLSCWGFRRGQAHWSDYPSGGVICEHLRRPAEASYLCVPMTAGNQTAGVLHLQVDRSENERGMPGFESMMEGMKRLAITAAGQIALAMVSLRLREELEIRSVRDPLTGLYNRRVLEAALNREIVRARRRGHPVSVVFIDLDHFKKFNDTFGHAAGDEVLLTLGKMFKDYYRGEDVVCRYGGEEFAIVMPEARPEDAAARAEGLRAKAEDLKIHFQGRELDRVTLSIGIAAFPEHASTPESLLRAADECLYRSKSAGRNRITVAAAPAESPEALAPATKPLA